MRYISLITLLILYVSDNVAQPITNSPNKGYSSNKSLPLLLSQEICNNNLDDDNNGLIDKSDFSCYFSSGSCNKSPIIWGCASAGDLVWVNLETGIEHNVGKMSQFMSDLTWASTENCMGWQVEYGR